MEGDEDVSYDKVYCMVDGLISTSIDEWGFGEDMILNMLVWCQLGQKGEIIVIM